MSGPDPFRSSAWDRLGNARTATRRAPARLAPTTVDPLARPVPSPFGVAALGVAAAMPVALVATFLFPADVPPLVALVAALVAATAGGLRASDREALRWTQAVTRVVGLYVVAVVTRAVATLAVDGPVADGVATVLSGRILALWVLVGTCFGIAQGVGRRAVDLTDAETLVQEGNATRAVLGWLASIVGVVLLIHALPASAPPSWAELAMVVAVLAALLLLADLRARVRSPGGTTDAIIDRPLRTTILAVAAALGATVLVAVSLVPLAAAARIPDLGPAISWLAEVIGNLFGDGREPSFDAGGSFDEVPPEREVVERPALGERWRPDFDVPDWVGWAVAGGVVVALLRPDRLVAAWRALLARLRVGSAASGETGVVDDAITPDGDDGSDGATSSPGAGRLAKAWQRIRPRPRDPRLAVLHDYARLGRILARRGYGRGTAETPLAHAARIGADPRFGELARAVSHARWSGHEVEPAQAARVRSLVDELTDDLPQPDTPEVGSEASSDA